MKTDKCKGQLTAGQFNLYKTWSGNLFGLRREEQDHEARGEIALGNRTERCLYKQEEGCFTSEMDDTRIKNLSG